MPDADRDISTADKMLIVLIAGGEVGERGTSALPFSGICPPFQTLILT